MILFVSVCLWILLDRYEICLYFSSFAVYISNLFFTSDTFFFITPSDVSSWLISYIRDYFSFSITSTSSLTNSRSSISICFGFQILLWRVDAGLTFFYAAYICFRFSTIYFFLLRFIRHYLWISESKFLSYSHPPVCPDLGLFL